jgi:uncharacterized membrane protein
MLFDPIPYGLFVAALMFDAVYTRSAEILWLKSASWLIAIGLLFAILPRLINFAWVWLPSNRPRARGEVMSFWINLCAIAAAIVNAFVHSRDAYGVMPEGLYLSIATVVLLAVARVVPVAMRSASKVSP